MAYRSTLALLASITAVTVADQVSIRSTAYSSGSFGPTPYQNFTSRPDLSPPLINLLTPPTSATAPGYVFLSYRAQGPGLKQPAPVIFDQDGSLVWTGPQYGS